MTVTPAACIRFKDSFTKSAHSTDLRTRVYGVAAGFASAGSAGAGLSASAASGLPGSSLASGSSASALPGSLLGLTAAGSLALGGLEVLGARVYDAQVRGFLSLDPVAAPVGAGWASNGYGFVGFSPVGLVDPWGLSPMSAADFAAYRQNRSSAQGSHVLSALGQALHGFGSFAAGNSGGGLGWLGSGGLFGPGAGLDLGALARAGAGFVGSALEWGRGFVDGARAWLGDAQRWLGDAWSSVQGFAAGAWEWTKDNWQYVLAGAVLAGGVLLGGPVGAGIVVGFLVSGGVELGAQAISHNGDFSKIDYKKVANASSVGGLAGGAGAWAGGLVTRTIATPALNTASSRVASEAAAKGAMGKLASGVFDSGVSNAVNGAGMEIFENGFTDPSAVVRKGAAGFASGVFTPVGALGATTGLNKAFKFTPDDVMSRRVTTTAGGALSGGVFAAGNYAISEERSEVNWDGARIEFFKGAASSALTSDPLKSVGFERPLQTMAGDTSAGQRVAVAGVSGVAVSVNGVAVEEISDDKQ